MQTGRGRNVSQSVSCDEIVSRHLPFSVPVDGLSGGAMARRVRACGRTGHVDSLGKRAVENSERPGLGRLVPGGRPSDGEPLQASVSPSTPLRVCCCPCALPLSISQASCSGQGRNRHLEEDLEGSLGSCHQDGLGQGQGRGWSSGRNHQCVTQMPWLLRLGRT